MRPSAPFGERKDSLSSMPVFRVFVSSTWLDLELERKAVEIALARLGETKFIGMEHFGSREETTLKTSLAEVDRSDLYLGIVAGRYGSGITAAEYRRAREQGLHCLLYKKQSSNWTESDPDQRARLQEFLDEIGSHHTLSPFTTPENLAAQVTADLHRWLVEKVLTPRLRESGFVSDLADSYLPAWPVFERLDLDRFTGRVWLTNAVDDFLARYDRGYFILEADAGLGKSAFLAHLVRERGWIHHFVELARGQDGIGPGLRNLAAQIALTWKPEYAGPLADVSRPDLLQNLLFSMAEQRDKTAPGEKIVLVVDGLDESAALPGQNVMGLPRVLPSGFYFLVSQRPVQVFLETDAPRVVFRLATEKRNEDDMREFLKRAAISERVAALLVESHIASADFVSTLLERSQGVWIYLHYILEELERGERRPLDLETLPHGLWSYYARHWRRHRAGPDWSTVELPLLASLAAAQEEVSERLLCVFAGVSDTTLVKRLLQEEWRPFLAASAGDERRYRCYHASFREFLEGNADRSHLTEWEEALTDELAAATGTAHGRIADRALEAWGGFDGGLKSLNDPPRRDLDDGYALRHVAAHLEGAGRLTDLSRLLRIEWTTGQRRENVWYTVHEKTKDLAGYLSDVGRVWRAADAASRTAIERGKPAVTVAIEARCALLIASVRSLASQVGPSLLAALVEKGIWEPKHALTYARQIPTATQRLLAMARLLLVLPEPHRGKALNEAVAAAKRCRAEGFADLPLGLPSELLTKLVRQELAAPLPRQSETLAALASKLPSDLLAEILSALRTADPTLFRAEFWATLVPLAPPAEREELICKAKEAADRMWTTRRLEILLLLADFLPCDERERLAREALERARRDEVGEEERVILLALTLPILKGLEQRAVAREALKSAFATRSFLVKRGLQELIPRLPPKLLDIADRRILRSWRIFSNWEEYFPFFVSRWDEDVRRIEASFFRVEKLIYRGQALAVLAPLLPEKLVERALQSALTIHGNDEKKVALDALAPRLTRLQLDKALASLLEGSVNGDIFRGRESLSDLIARLSVLRSAGPSCNIDRGEKIEIDNLPRAEAAARKWHSAEYTAEALIRLAAAAPASERPRLLGQALRFTRRVLAHPQAKTKLLLAAALLNDGPERQYLLAKALRYLKKWPKDSWSFSERARDMLVAMAPHLSERLLRDALAWASRLKNESDMQPIFQELLPRLPEAQVAEALLSHPKGWDVLVCKDPIETGKADRFRAVGWIGKVLGRLWILMPQRVRSSVIADLILHLFAAHKPGRLRASILVGLALASEENENWVLYEALPVTEHLHSPSVRVKLLGSLIPCLSKFQIGSATGRAVAAALAISDSMMRANALDTLDPYLHPYFQTRLRRTVHLLRHPSSPSEPTDATALESLREAASADVLLRRLECLAKEDREPLLAQARQIAEGLEIPALRAWILLQLVPYLSASEGEKVVREWIKDHHFSGAVSYLIENWGHFWSPFGESVARAVLDTTQWSSEFSEVFVASAPHLPDAVLLEALTKIWTINSLEERTRALRALSARLVSRPAADLHPLWREALQRVAGGTREAAFSGLAALLPVLEMLGGQEGVQDAFNPAP